jgi:hypothetical protein
VRNCAIFCSLHGHHHVATKRCTHPKRRFWKDEPTFQRLNQSAFSFVVITASYLRFSYGLPPRRESDRLSVGTSACYHHLVIPTPSCPIDTSTCHHRVRSTEISTCHRVCYHHLVISTSKSAGYHHAINGHRRVRSIDDTSTWHNLVSSTDTWS